MTNEAVKENETVSMKTNPYAGLTAKEGKPFLLSRRRDGTAYGITINQRWNAAFMIERYHPQYNVKTRYYFLPRTLPEKGEFVSEHRMCAIMADDLAKYWREFHPDDADDLLLRLTHSVLSASEKMLRGRVLDR